MKTFFLGLTLCLGYSNVVLTQACDVYPKSRYGDLSFEGRAEFNFDELYALYNFLDAPPSELASTLSDFTSLYTISFVDLENQESYITQNGLDCSCLRLCPQEIASLSSAEQVDYWTHITYMENNFTFSSNDLATIEAHLLNLKPYSSTELSVVIDNLIQYLGLAGLLHYTKMEMFRDMTGFCSLSDYISVMSDPVNFPLEFNRGDDQGLGAHASIQRLQDIVSCNSSGLKGDFNANNRNASDTQKGLAVEVNNDQFSKNINLIVTNNNYKYKIYSASMVDINGNLISTITDNIVLESNRQMSHQVSTFDLSAGLYFITVVSENKATTKKVMVFNN